MDAKQLSVEMLEVLRRQFLAAGVDPLADSERQVVLIPNEFIKSIANNMACVFSERLKEEDNG